MKVLKAALQKLASADESLAHKAVIRAGVVCERCNSRCVIPQLPKKSRVQLSDKCFAGLIPKIIFLDTSPIFWVFLTIYNPPNLRNVGPHPFHPRCFLSHPQFLPWTGFLHPSTSINSFPKAIILLATLGFFAALLLFPELVASGLLAYSFGLRHAVDVDHIAPRKGPFSMGTHIYHMSYCQYSWLITIIKILIMDGMTINHIVSIDHGSHQALLQMLTLRILGGHSVAEPTMHHNACW